MNFDKNDCLRFMNKVLKGVNMRKNVSSGSTDAET